MRLLKLVAILFVMILIAVAGVQMFDYWSSVALFSFAPTILTGFFHLIVLGALVYLLIFLHKQKV